MNYYAKSDWKTTVKAHCDDVARLAESYGREIGMEHLAGTAALFHDVAKYADLFQDVLHKKASSVDHACTGAALFDLVTSRKCRHGVEAIAGQRLDPTEEIRVHLLSLDEVKKLLHGDRIRQALMAAPLWRYLYEEGL